MKQPDHNNWAKFCGVNGAQCLSQDIDIGICVFRSLRTMPGSKQGWKKLTLATTHQANVAPTPESIQLERLSLRFEYAEIPKYPMSNELLTIL
jgi:hypothetical protein